MNGEALADGKIKAPPSLVVFVRPISGLWRLSPKVPAGAL
jgi:hypothetical protein